MIYCGSFWIFLRWCGHFVHRKTFPPICLFSLRSTSLSHKESISPFLLGYSPSTFFRHQFLWKFPNNVWTCSAEWRPLYFLCTELTTEFLPLLPLLNVIVMAICGLRHVTMNFLNAIWSHCWEYSSVSLWLFLLFLRNTVFIFLLLQ